MPARPQPARPRAASPQHRRRPAAAVPARRRLPARVVLLGAPLTLALSACASTAAPAGVEAVGVRATDTTCEVASSSFTAGVNALKIVNAGRRTTEVYVYTPSGSIVAERENIGPGLTISLTFEVAAGQYQIACKPGGTGEGIRQTITVTGQGGTTTTQDQRLVAAVAAYRAWVQEQADAGLPLVEKFTQAVTKGDLATARTLYAPSREAWERVEPVAESFGTLDPEMDLREADLEAGQTWTGWHRLEKAVFTTKDVTGQAKYAAKLLADYQTFQKTVATAQITPTSMANGAKELLDEVATGKITGEEDVWSGTDLSDFAANVEGADKVYTLLRAVVGDNDAALRDQLDAGFAGVETALKAHADGDGWVDYRTVSEADRKKLSAAVDALAEPLSQLAAAVTTTSSATATAAS